MVRVRGMGEYAMFEGDVDRETVAKLHERVGEFREEFLESHAIQDLLLNDGYLLENRPKSWFDFGDATIRRMKLVPHLMYVNHIIDTATRPQLSIAKIPSIIIPDKLLRCKCI